MGFKEQDRNNAVDAWTDMSCAKIGVTEMRKMKDEDDVVDALTEQRIREGKHELAPADKLKEQ